MFLLLYGKENGREKYLRLPLLEIPYLLLASFSWRTWLKNHSELLYDILIVTFFLYRKKNHSKTSFQDTWVWEHTFELNFLPLPFTIYRKKKILKIIQCFNCTFPIFIDGVLESNLKKKRSLRVISSIHYYLYRFSVHTSTTRISIRRKRIENCTRT